jgi:hypothetical protein
VKLHYAARSAAAAKGLTRVKLHYAARSAAAAKGLTL